MPAVPRLPASGRRRLRLGLRGLMVLVLLVGGGLGWLLHRIRTQREAIAAVREDGAVQFFHEQDGEMSGAEPPGPRWLRRWLGDELFQAVREVDLFGPESPTVLAMVARFDRLETLYVSDLKIDLGFARLEGLAHLRKVIAQGPQVDDPALAALARFPALQSLHIGGAGATDAGLAELARLPCLAELSLTHDPHCTDAGLARALGGMPALRRLLLRDDPPPLLGTPPPHAHRVAATLAALVRHHPDLEVLDLGDFASAITAADLATIGRLARLRRLSLVRCPVTDAGVAHLRPLARLESLDLTGTAITDAGAEALGDLAGLRRLELYDTRITDVGLAPLARLANLEILIVGHTDVTLAGVRALQAARRGLDISSHTGHNSKRDRP